MVSKTCTMHKLFHISTILLLILLAPSRGASTKDVFLENPRVPRDNKYYPGRFSTSSSLNRAIKPEDSPEAHEPTPAPVEKRCSRCDSSYSDSRYPYESRTRYDDRRRPYEDRYDDRRYDRYDRYEDRYERRPSYDRYDRERYDRNDGRDRYEGRDRYDRDRYDRDRYYEYDRGFGYDNRGYDYRDRAIDSPGLSNYEGGNRGYYSQGRPEYWGTGGGYASGWNYGGGRDENRDRLYDGFKPWDETYKGLSGWDDHGRGFYFAGGIPEAGAEHWGSKKRHRYGGYNRPREYEGYRSTSYLYGRPSSSTTNRPSNQDDPSVTQNPQQQDNNSG